MFGSYVANITYNDNFIEIFMVKLWWRKEITPWIHYFIEQDGLSCQLQYNDCNIQWECCITQLPCRGEDLPEIVKS